MQKSVISANVLIVGGGPVGLLTAFQLAQAGCSVQIVDRDSKLSGTGTTGRANALYSRAAEMLDQLGLAERILQQCHIVRESYTYNDKRERVVPGRVWNFVENIEDSFFDFGIMLRQQFIESSIRDSLESRGITLRERTECVHFTATEADAGESHVLATLKDLVSGEEYTVKSKYLVGADGGKSFVRRHLGVPFEGDTTSDKWIRIDGKVKTNIPTARAYGSIESASHGNVLWAPLDRGITRIGYVFTPEQEAACGGDLTEQVVVQEAIAAVKPFEVEFESVEWWTLYIIGQRVAATYQPHPRIILVGDACHTHSSGAAQGLNTGIHDAINLGWKLALVVKGLAKESLLETYGSERRGAALRLIEFDRKISTLMANKWPPGMPESPDDDINEVLAATFDDAAGYNTGLKISYDESIINTAPDVNRAYSSIQPGLRAPDANLLKVGTLESIRLQSVTPNRACMYVMAFVGEPRITLPNMACFSTYMADPCSFKAVYPEGLVQVVTIAAAANTRADAEETLGIHPFGTVYFDDRRQAHQRYGVNLRSGALVVVRPDGHVGFTAELSQNGGQAVTHYFERFLVKN